MFMLNCTSCCKVIFYVSFGKQNTAYDDFLGLFTPLSILVEAAPISLFEKNRLSEKRVYSASLMMKCESKTSLAKYSVELNQFSEPYRPHGSFSGCYA